jgi:hypothetical protein
MTLAHIAYLFPPNRFKEEIDVLRGNLDREEYTALSTHANAAIQKTPWIWEILDRFGYHQEDLKEWDRGLPSFWTSAILAQYLSPCSSIDCSEGVVSTQTKLSLRVRNWQIMKEGLPLIGWLEQDTTLLIEGMSIEWLVCSDVVSDPITRLPPSYAWHSIGRVGWLDEQQVARLLTKLQETQRDFLNLDSSRLALREAQNQLVTRERIESAFVCTVNMLRTARREQQGLLLAIVS